MNEQTKNGDNKAEITEDVKSAISTLKNRTNYWENDLISQLTYPFQIIVEQGQVSTEWKTVTIPGFKQSDKTWGL